METTNGLPVYPAAEAIPPLHEHYLDLPLEEAYDWRGIISGIMRQRDIPKKLYVVDFRSTRHPRADPEEITFLDAAAYAEAARSEALLCYSGGKVDAQGRAGSWCLWTEAAAARLALSGPAHQQCVLRAHGDLAKGILPLYIKHTVKMYDVYHLSERTIFRPVYKERKQPA